MTTIANLADALQEIGLRVDDPGDHVGVAPRQNEVPPERDGDGDDEQVSQYPMARIAVVARRNDRMVPLPALR
jgi:hypothetical protein